MLSVWKSDEKLLIYASLIFPSEIILFEKKYRAFYTVFHHQTKNLEVRKKKKTVTSGLADTPLFRTLAISGKVHIPGKSGRGLTGDDSCYYGLPLLRNYGHFIGTKVTILLF